MGTYKTVETIENKYENALRYLVEIVNTLRHKSSLSDHVFSIKKDL